jgi:hypothetical protein
MEGGIVVLMCLDPEHFVEYVLLLIEQAGVMVGFKDNF